jgi:hypothetical protein
MSAPAIRSYSACDAAAGIAGRIGFVIVGIGVDDQGGTIRLEHRIRLVLLQRDRRFDDFDAQVTLRCRLSYR